MNTTNPTVTVSTSNMIYKSKLTYMAEKLEEGTLLGNISQEDFNEKAQEFIQAAKFWLPKLTPDEQLYQGELKIWRYYWGDNIPFPGKNPNLGLFTLVQQAGQQIDGSQEQPLSPGYYSTTHDSFSEHQQHGEESIVDDLSREHFHPSYEIYTSSRLQQGSYDDNQHVMVYQPGDNQQEAIYSGQEHAVKQPVFYNEHHAPPPPSHPPPSKATATRLWVESMLTSIPHFQHYSPMWGYNPSTGEPWLSLRTLYPSSYNKLIGKGGRHDVIAAFLNKIYMRTNVKFRIEYLWVNRQSLILLWIEFTHLHTCVDMRAWEVLGELRAFLQEWIKIPDPGRVDFAYDMFMNRASGNRASLALPAGFPSGPNATIAAWADVDTKSTCQNESEPWLSQQQKHQIQQFPYGSSDQTNFPNHYIARQSQNYAAPATGAGGPVGQAPYHGPHKSSRRASRGILGPRYESGNRISKQRHTDAQFMHDAQTGPQGFVGSIQPRAPHFPGHGRGSGPVGQIGGSVGCPPSLSKDTVQTQPVKNKERWLGLS